MISYLFQNIKGNSEIDSYILHRNFNNSLFSKVFPNSLKKADITLVFKKDKNFLKNNRPKIYDQINDYFHFFQNYNTDFTKDLMHNTAYYF